MRVRRSDQVAEDVYPVAGRREREDDGEEAKGDVSEEGVWMVRGDLWEDGGESCKGSRQSVFVSTRRWR